MASRAGQLRKQVVELVEGRPGWKLEPRSTPGATPLWCYVIDGQVEFSVTVEDASVRLYVMATDEEIVFEGTDELAEWMQTHRADALGDRPRRPEGKERFRRFFEWS
jgi:hypothetical protein